jgi:hypothetical protein
VSTITCKDGTQIDDQDKGGAHALPDTGKDRINQDLLDSINSGSDGEDAEPVDAAHAA